MHKGDANLESVECVEITNPVNDIPKGPIMKLQERVDRLERENRWMKRIGLFLMLFCAVGVSLGFQADQQATDQYKERRSRLKHKMVQFVPLGEDTKMIMDKLVEQAKNGDVQSAELILETIYRNSDD